MPTSIILDFVTLLREKLGTTLVFCLPTILLLIAALGDSACQYLPEPKSQRESYVLLSGPRDQACYTTAITLQRELDIYREAKSSPSAYKLNLVETSGAEENGQRLTASAPIVAAIHPGFRSKGTLAILQSDAPELLAKNSTVQVIHPLHREYFTLVVNNDIDSTAQLVNQRIALPNHGSGGRRNATAYLKFAKVEIEEFSYGTLDQAFELLKMDKIDGFFSTAGHPNASFETYFEDNYRTHILSFEPPLTSKNLTGLAEAYPPRQLSYLHAFQKGRKTMLLSADALLCTTKHSSPEDNHILELLNALHNDPTRMNTTLRYTISQKTENSPRASVLHQMELYKPTQEIRGNLHPMTLRYIASHLR